MLPPLTLPLLVDAATSFFAEQSDVPVHALYGASDGKSTGTHWEHGLKDYLRPRASFDVGSSASGLDFPSLGTDLKVTARDRPQSSATMTDPAERIFGLGYHILLVLYVRREDPAARASRFRFDPPRFIAAEQTGDHATTRMIRRLMQGGATDGMLRDVILDELPLTGPVAADAIVARLRATGMPGEGILTMSPAAQWRLHYARAAHGDANDPGTVTQARRASRTRPPPDQPSLF